MKKMLYLTYLPRSPHRMIPPKYTAVEVVDVIICDKFLGLAIGKGRGAAPTVDQKCRRRRRRRRRADPSEWRRRRDQFGGGGGAARPT